MPDVPLSATAPAERVTLSPPQRDLAGILRNIGGPLFAILDASRNPLRILGLLRSSGEEYQSLYEGLQGRMLETSAPHLVRLPESSPLLETLIAQGWENHWGIFIVSAAHFEALRKHFRTFLMVKSPEGKHLYFRYYDPRVLRVYLPTCNAAETNFVFGPVAAYLCEGEASDTLLVFQPGQESAQCEVVKLSGTLEGGIGEQVDPFSQATGSLKATLFSH